MAMSPPFVSPFLPRIIHHTLTPHSGVSTRHFWVTSAVFDRVLMHPLHMINSISIFLENFQVLPRAYKEFPHCIHSPNVTPCACFKIIPLNTNLNLSNQSLGPRTVNFRFSNTPNLWSRVRLSSRTGDALSALIHINLGSATSLGFCRSALDSSRLQQHDQLYPNC